MLVAQKDFFKQNHEEIEDVTNLEVLMLMKSMKSRELVRETFNWQYYYYYLEPKGIEYLREYLHLPEDIIPATLKKPAARPARAGPVPGEGSYGGKKMGPGGDFNPEFSRGEGQDGYRRSGGFGRGGGATN